MSSELTLGDDSSSSCGVKYEPPPIWAESNTLDDYVNSTVFDKRGDKSGLDKGGSISQKCIEDKLKPKGRKMQSFIANPAQDKPVEFNRFPAKKLERDGFKISKAIPSTNHAVSNIANTGERTRRFKLHIRPQPDNQDKNSSNETDKGNCDPWGVTALISSINDLQEGHVVTDLINFKDEGGLNRKLIEHEMKRWEIEKERLQKYIDTLKEAVGSSDESSGLMLSRNRKRKLELHVK